MLFNCPVPVVCLLASLCFPAQAAVLSIGHRGNALFAPENTVASFTAARGKADYMELDAQITADGQFVVMHDSTVDRTTDGTGSLATNTLAELKLLDAGSWFAPQFTGERIPTLQEALAAINPYGTALIEQKAGNAAAYSAELRRLNAISNVVVQSFDWAFLTSLHALEPGLRLGALGSGALTGTKVTNILNTGATLVAWEQSTLTSNEVFLVHRAGLELFVWTVDGPAIQTFIDLGVDGIISNDPGLVKSLQQPVTNGPAAFGTRLMSYWKMDDGLANSRTTTVGDSKGPNTGTLVVKDGLSHWVSGESALFDGALNLEGTNASVDIPAAPSMDIGTNAVTLSLWVKLRDLPSGSPEAYGGIFDSVQDCFGLYLDRAGQELKFKVTVANGEAARPGIAQVRLQTNQWLHVVGTFSGSAGPYSGQATIYLNGVARDVHTGPDGGSGTGLTGTLKTGQATALGRNGTQSIYPFYGCVDDVALWSRALSPSEVRALYDAGRQGLSLGGLLRRPTSLLQVTSVKQAALNQFQITFRNSGPYSAFKLLRAQSLETLFVPVSGLSPISLGGGNYRFDYTSGTAGPEFFRVEGQ